MTQPLRVRAHFADGKAFLCSACIKWKETGRVYEFPVTLEGPDGFVAGMIEMCETCRKDFTLADFELEAPEMEREAARREALSPEHPRLVSDETVDALIDRYGPADRFGRQHLTFPPDKD